MSVAGIRSNRGDNYQTLVAFDWALTVLSDKDYDWLELDATSNPVDDVVVGKADGIIICCQCKKNQPDFKAWSIADLRGELEKAVTLLADNSQARVRFCSRSEFGTIAKLRESAAAYKSEDEYRLNLTNEHAKTDGKLAVIIADQDAVLSTYEFLNRTSFDISPDFDRMIILLHERLHPLASNSKAAFDVLWTKLDMLGGRIGSDNLSASARYRLTKNDLEDILHSAGAMLARAMPIGQLHASFARTSAIGRSWLRDIAGIRISSAVVNDLLAAIDGKKRSVLLTGMPGSGKTCVLLSLQEALEQRMETRNDLVSLFIQSREYADLATAQERQAQGLPHEWVEQAARLADESDVVVIIDSLDVLSIAREHSVLTYFLTQIDQLLLAPRITVVTACREFDRKYDRRIATRQWGEELRCPKLDWANEIVPLLNQLGIDSTSIDTITRELIRNPRELALFVELARRVGSFDVVTSQSLAQRYLNTIVQDSPALGEVAMKSIEAIAVEMLNTRSLSIPRQRFNASQSTLRQLQSLNILQITHDDRLTFGHQTLLDVLVISGALRQGLTLIRFIQGLPAVPFVRPAIRSFVAQLATGERREFRKQLRTVFKSSVAFNVRSMIAKSFAQQKPHDEDWPLIRDLRDSHREVYQVIYMEASSIEWHHFWLKYLVPLLLDSRDTDGLNTHISKVVRWKNDDVVGIIGFWKDMLSLNWLDSNEVASRISHSLSDYETANLPLLVPLLDQLLSRSIPDDQSDLGRVVARCVAFDAVDDKFLWRYIAGGVNKDVVQESQIGTKLYCKPHHFGNGDFLADRMGQSDELFDLALKSVEEWSRIKEDQYGKTRIGYRSGFLKYTSYDDVHTENDHRLVDRQRIVLDAIETAVFDHAQKHSLWWQRNRNRLSFSHEGALCYFAILALTSTPLHNIELIGRLLCTKNLLEFKLSYELNALIRAAYTCMDGDTQDAIMKTICRLWEEEVIGEEIPYWILKKRAEFIDAVPIHLRCEEAQVILTAYEELYGTLTVKPEIGSRGGWVGAPFTYDVFLSCSNSGVVQLLLHYSGNKSYYDDILVGGEREVGRELREASSRYPSRFLSLLSDNWVNISPHFSDEIMDGVASYMAYLYGELRPEGTWKSMEEADVSMMVHQILDELERHPAHWRLNRSTANALNACAHVIQSTENAERLVFLAFGFGLLEEESAIYGDHVDLINDGINMKSGKVVEALIVLVGKLQDQGLSCPQLLLPALRLFANSKHPAVRSLIIRRLPNLQSRNPGLSWELFERCMKKPTGLWRIAEPYIYMIYRKEYARIAPLLAKERSGGSEEGMVTWARISALSALPNHIDHSNFVIDLNELNKTEAWSGAASVWTYAGNLMLYREQCLEGIEAGLRKGGPHASAISRKLGGVFTGNAPYISIPVRLLRLCFRTYESDTKDTNQQLSEFGEWLSITSQRDPELALVAAEIYLAYLSNRLGYCFDNKNQLVQLVTRLFAEAEEREESDCGEMLQRVVALQDLLLTLGVSSMNEWLTEAERQ